MKGKQFRTAIIRIDFDEAMDANCSMQNLVSYFKEGNDEEYTIPVIRKHLRTEEQKKMLYDLDLSIEDCLNGRYGSKEEAQITAMYNDWNAKLGTKVFGF